MEDDIPDFKGNLYNRRDKHWNLRSSKNRCWDDIEEDEDFPGKSSMDHEKAEIPLKIIKQLQTEEDKVGEEVTGGNKHNVGQFAKEQVTTGEHDPIQFDDTESVTMEGQANIKVKSQVAVDDATDRVQEITYRSDGVENITSKGEKITNKCLQYSDVVTTTGGGGFRIFSWILCLLVLLPAFATGNKTFAKSVLNYYPYGQGDVRLTCTTNDSSLKTAEWRVSKVLGENNTLIAYGNLTTDESKYKPEDIDGVQNLIIKNFGEEDQKPCYYCIHTNSIASICTNITGPEITDLLSMCKGKVCHQYAECDNYQCKCKLGYYGDGITCTAYCGGNKCVDHATCNGETCKCDNGYHGNGTLKCEEKEKKNGIGLIIGLVVGGIVVMAIVIIAGCYFYKRRQHLRTTNRDNNDGKDEENISLPDKEPNEYHDHNKEPNGYHDHNKEPNGYHDHSP